MSGAFKAHPDAQSPQKYSSCGVISHSSLATAPIQPELIRPQAASLNALHYYISQLTYHPIFVGNPAYTAFLPVYPEVHEQKDVERP
jgi:hypothetical protein